LAVIIPAYNRPELLKEAIQATTDQSYPPTEIVVVDNASRIPVSRSLGSWLDDKKTVTLLRVEPNVWGGGAFYEGLKYAFQKGFDGYMFFDDDAEPGKDCIKNLMAHFSDDVGFVAPLVYDSVAEAYQLFQNKKMSKGHLYDIPIFPDPQSITTEDRIKVDANATTGILVNHLAIQEAGNLNRHLKTYGDDTEFALRINRKFDSYLVPKALLIHKVQPSDISTQPLKNYYWVRNRFFIIRNYSHRKYMAQYALETAWDATKRMVRRGSFKTSFYRLYAIWEGIMGTIPAETVEESLYKQTPDVKVTVEKQAG